MARLVETSDEFVGVRKQFELSADCQAMEDSWVNMYNKEPIEDGKALLALAFRIRQQAMRELSAWKQQATSLLASDVRGIELSADFMLFESHLAYASELLNADAHSEVIKHTQNALALSARHGNAWKKRVATCLFDYEKLAYANLGERNHFLVVAKAQVTAFRLAETEGVPLGISGHERIVALVLVASTQIELRDFDGAMAHSREAVGVQAPQTSINYARMKLGTALMANGEAQEALREFERTDREWTSGFDGDGGFDGNELQRIRKALDHNLRTCRQLVANKEGDTHGAAMARAEIEAAAAAAYGDEYATPIDCAARAATLLVDGKPREATDAAERAIKLTILHQIKGDPMAMMQLPATEARAFTLANCFLRDDDRAAERLTCVKAALRRCARGQLEESCAICLQKLVWPARLAKRDMVRIHSLTRATQHNDKLGTIVRPPTGEERRAEVEITGSKPGERITIKVRSSNLASCVAEPGQRTYCAASFERPVHESQRAVITGCMHAFHAKCIKRAVDEGRTTCPVCRAEGDFVDTVAMCELMPSWDRPSETY